MFLIVSKVQQGLLEARSRGMSIPSPGRVDNRWGPMTERSLDAYLSAIVPPFHGEVAVDPDNQRIEFVDADNVAQGLYQLAQQYAMRQDRAQAPAPSAPAPTTSMTAPARRARPEASPAPTLQVRTNGPKWGMWFAVVLGLAGIGGMVWYFSGRRKGRW